MDRRDSTAQAAPEREPSQSERARGGEGWPALLAAPVFLFLALLCCGGPLLAGALVATGAGAWLAGHGYLLGALLLLILAAVLLWRWRLRVTRGS
jgi:hypothetical protein